MTETTKTAARQRPLSPHLQIYRWSLTMALSILHRATGAALSVGLLMIVWWLVAAAGGEASYATFRAFAASPIGLLLMLGFSGAFYLHLANGIRHLIWDAGCGLEKEAADKSAKVAVIAAIVMTVVTWLLVVAYW